MNISASVTSLLALTGKNRVDLVPILNMSNQYTLSNKFVKSSWSGADLIKVAEFCGCKLAFVLPDGERVVLAIDENNLKG